jgi:hypothetical protein
LELHHSTTVFPTGRFDLAFAPDARFLIILPAPQLGQDPRFLTFLLESAQGTVDRLITINHDQTHAITPFLPFLEFSKSPSFGFCPQLPLAHPPPIGGLQPEAPSANKRLFCETTLRLSSLSLQNFKKEKRKFGCTFCSIAV